MYAWQSVHETRYMQDPNQAVLIELLRLKTAVYDTFWRIHTATCVLIVHLYWTCWCPGAGDVVDFCGFPLTPVSANFVPSVIPALSYLLAYLILCTQAKLFRLPHSHAVRALQLLVSHVKAHYDHRYSTYIASIIRIMVSFLCTTVIRKEESCEIGCHTPRTPLIICQRLQWNYE